MKEDKRGRPSKIYPFLAVMEEFFKEGSHHPVGTAIIHTDEELLWMVNDRLPAEERISMRSFVSYKSGELRDNEALRAFSACYKKALMEQRDNLFQKLEGGDPGSWQKYAWIIERKFDSWNLRNKLVDETPVPKQLVFRVSKAE